MTRVITAGPTSPRMAALREYDVICLEDLPVSNLSRRPQAKPDGNGGYEHNGAAQKAGLNKSIQDAGWYNFREILTFKAVFPALNLADRIASAL